MALYAAYGSNMDPAQMMQRCPSSPMFGTGWLRGWRLTFGGEDLGWEGALATIVPDSSCAVFVVLYDVPSADEHLLDSWEGADIGLYTKLRMRIDMNAARGSGVDLDALPGSGGTALAWLYALRAYEGGLPSARYLGVISEAAETAGAPADYIRELRLRPCRSVSN